MLTSVTPSIEAPISVNVQTTRLASSRTSANVVSRIERIVSGAP